MMIFPLFSRRKMRKMTVDVDVIEGHSVLHEETLKQVPDDEHVLAGIAVLGVSTRSTSANGVNAVVPPEAVDHESGEVHQHAEDAAGGAHDGVHVGEELHDHAIAGTTQGRHLAGGPVPEVNFPPASRVPGLCSVRRSHRRTRLFEAGSRLNMFAAGRRGGGKVRGPVPAGSFPTAPSIPAVTSLGGATPSFGCFKGRPPAGGPFVEVVEDIVGDAAAAAHLGHEDIIEAELEDETELQEGGVHVRRPRPP